MFEQFTTKLQFLVTLSLFFFSYSSEAKGTFKTVSSASLTEFELTRE